MSTNLILIQDPAIRHDELHRDIAAVIDADTIDIDNICTRPAILRRLAALVADCLPAGVDRLVGTMDDASLLTAVALHSGLPFVLVTPGSPRPIRGRLHPSERVALLETLQSEEPNGVRSLLDDAGVELVGAISALLTRRSGRGVALEIVPGVTRTEGLEYERAVTSEC